MPQSPGYSKDTVRLTPYIYLFVLMAATILVSNFLRSTQAARNSLYFDKVKDNVTNTVRQRLRYYENALRHAAAMFMDEAKVSPEEFRIYSHNMGLTKHYPGMTAMGYAEFVPKANVEDFVREMRQNQGYEDYDVWPRHGQTTEYYCPVKFIEPFFNYMKPLAGFAFMSQQSRKDAMYTAALKGEATVTKEIELFIENSSISNRGFNIFFPVYHTEVIPNTAQERANAIKGFIFGVFNSYHLFNIIMRENNFFQRSVGVNVYQRTDEGVELIYDSTLFYAANPGENSKFVSNSQFELGNMQWILTISSLPALEKSLSSTAAWYVLAIGVLISLLAFYISRNFYQTQYAMSRRESETREIAYGNSLMIKASSILGSTLNTELNLREFANFLSTYFADCSCLQLRAEHNTQYIFSVSPRVNLVDLYQSETSLKQHCLEVLRSCKLKEKIEESKKYILNNHADIGPFRSYLVIGIEVREKLYGIMFLGNLSEERTFSSQQIQCLEQIKKFVAVSVENSHLFQGAQVANKLKDEFLATISHELRTPLNVIYGHTQLLLTSPDLNEDTKEQIETIFRSAKTQKAIIDDLLDASAIISGKIKFEPTILTIGDCVKRAIESVQLEAQKKDIQVEYINEGDCYIRGVKTRLIQIFWNLLTNSIKFTPVGGRIVIRHRREGEVCSVSVCDNGRGIEADMIPYIFEKFRQVDNQDRKTGGLGLGLSIVSHLVELHSGNINVRSEGIGKGSTFTVHLPPASAEEIEKISMKVVKKKKEKVMDISGVCVLAVDDEPDSLEVVSQILQSYNAKVCTAANTDEALEVIDKIHPDVLISDLAMPEKDGLVLIKELRSKEEQSHTHMPAIALTAYAHEANKKAALNSGYDYYLSKPVNKKKLIQAVEKVLPTHVIGEKYGNDISP